MHGWHQVPFWILLSFFAVLFIYPFIWLVSASFKPRGEVFDNRLIPATFTLDNWGQVWRVSPLLTWLGNSGLVGLLAAGTVTASSALVAFGFAYFRFPAKNLLFGLVLSTMMLPGMVTMIPVFLIWKEVGLVGTQVPLWAQNLTGSAFYIFLLRQFFLGLPRELFEAARVDGCSYWGLFWRIAAPLSRPALIIVFIFEFQASWDDVLKPLIYLGNKTDLYTVPIGLNSLFVKYNPIAGGEGDFQYIVTASLISAVPLILIFLFGQRFFIEGIASQARKG
ncbi:carbohydrate ABC transporter permease [Nakamurella endophytica]|uniref:carbohydrate ABC transporter permease n=1 Tax=Nakamurella endophytica TaxID=1748367 RepID=UPI003570DBC7